MRRQAQHGIAGRDVMDTLRCWTAVLGFGVLVVHTVLAAGARADETGSPEAAFEVTDGLVDWQVLQRGEGDRVDVRVSGTAGATGVVEARWVESDAPAAQDPAWRKIADVAGGKWEGTITGLPTGGEYTVSLRLVDAAGTARATGRIEHVLVGDLWVLAGQSNMEGYGYYGYVYRKELETPTPLVHNFESSDRWALAEEPLHWLLESPDPVHHAGFASPDKLREVIAERRSSRVVGAGLGLAFAKKIAGVTGVPIGLVPCAHGGTSMSQWDPARKAEGGTSLYGSMMRRIQAVGGRMTGVLWYQGESDAFAGEVGAYPDKLAGLVAAIRSDVGDPNLPFCMVQISRLISENNISAENAGRDLLYQARINRFIQQGGALWPYWHAIQRAQLEAGRTIPGVVTVSAIDLSLDDQIHISTPGLKRLGRRLARAALHEAYGRRDLTPGQRLASVDIIDAGFTIRLCFEGVCDQLLPPRHIAGFTLVKPDGSEASMVFDARVDPTAPTCVLIKLARCLMPGTVLWYGAGLNPYCNLRDAADMATFAFGPIKLDACGTWPAP